jgi:hypothetical protein
MRNNLDFYPTPTFATELLIENYKHIIRGPVLEPCCGTGAIAKPLQNYYKVYQTDIDPAQNPVDGVFDAKQADVYTKYYNNNTKIESVVTNPPFNCAMEILNTAYNAYNTKIIAFLLRLSFLEPTYERSSFLSQYPPNHIYVLPRISFTGDGKTDSVTCAWMIWDKNDQISRIKVFRKTK